MNNVLISGRIFSSPDTVFVPIGDANNIVSRFTIAAYDDNYDSTEADNDNVDFIECLAFGETARMMNSYFVKGVRVVCGGKLRNYRFKDPNWAEHFTNILVVNYLEFCGNEGTKKKNAGITKDKTVRSQDKTIEKLYEEYVKNDMPCINEDDYYHLARGVN